MATLRDPFQRTVNGGPADPTRSGRTRRSRPTHRQASHPQRRAAASQAAKANKVAPASDISLTKAQADLASLRLADELRRAEQPSRGRASASRRALADVPRAPPRTPSASFGRFDRRSLARVHTPMWIHASPLPADLQTTTTWPSAANLIALGFGDGLSVTSSFDGATQAAVRSWQASRSLPITGEVRARDVVVMPGPIQIESWAAGIEPGAAIAATGPADLATVTPISTVPDSVPTPDAALTTTQRVMAELPLEDRAKVEEGATVTVELPDDTTVSATVSVIGSVPVEDKETGARWVEVTLVPDEAVSEIWIGASVTVKVVDELAADVLVARQLARVLVEGGRGRSRRRIVVEAGGSRDRHDADGFVEISGDGLDAGQRSRCRRNALELRGVVKSYAGSPPVYALAGVDLAVRPGEMVAVVGPSGSGKSTMLNMMGTLDRPTEGTVLVDGVDTTDLDDDALTAVRGRRIGFVFQRFFLLAGVTTVDNVANGLLCGTAVTGAHPALDSRARASPHPCAQ